MGPAIGAVLYVGIRELLQVIAPGLHLTIVGLLILGVVLFMRDGVVAGLARTLRRAQPRRGEPRGAHPTRRLA